MEQVNGVNVRRFIQGKEIDAPAPVWQGSAWEWPRVESHPTPSGSARDMEILALAMGEQLMVPFNKNSGKASQATRLQSRVKALENRTNLRYAITVREGGIYIVRVK